jgi:hypothetical protein
MGCVHYPHYPHYLEVSRCDRFTSDGLRELSGLIALTSLNMGGCVQVSDNGMLALAGLTTLTLVDLSYCRLVSDDELRVLAGLTAINTLNLRGCKQVSGDGWLTLLAGHTALTSLHVSWLARSVGQRVACTGRPHCPATAAANVRSSTRMGPGGRLVHGTIGAALAARQEKRRAGYGDLG